ncbi:MAG: succinate--CoA ligase subunit alpha [Planctomycetota bacterium]
MSILVDKNTKVIVQGITGSQGIFHAKLMRDFGTKVVGGVTPGKGGTEIEGFPVFDSVQDAVKSTGADASCIFVPPAFAADAIMEAADAGIEVIVVITEGIPVQDALKAKKFVCDSGSVLIGPNSPGIISPGKCKIGILPQAAFKEGNVGVLSRSGTLTYEATAQMCRLGIGQSTAIGLGGDPVVGTIFLDGLRYFADDPQTKAVFLIGEIGGTAEEEAAEFIRGNYEKPVCAFIAGTTAPPGKRMGHAGAIIAGGKGTAAEKIYALKEAGVVVAETPADMGTAMANVLKKK